MKNLIFILAIFTSFNLFSQTNVNQTIQNSNTTEYLNSNIFDYDPKVIGDKTADEASNWSQEEKDWFKSTFIHKRGQFKVPEKPITVPYFE
jgi:hypothetical protein